MKTIYLALKALAPSATHNKGGLQQYLTQPKTLANSYFYSLAVDHYLENLSPDKLYNQRTLIKRYLDHLDHQLLYNLLPTTATDTLNINPRVFAIEATQTQEPYILNLVADVTIPPRASRIYMVRFLNKNLTPNID